MQSSNSIQTQCVYLCSVGVSGGKKMTWTEFRSQCSFSLRSSKLANISHSRSAKLQHFMFSLLCNVIISFFKYNVIPGLFLDSFGRFCRDEKFNNPLSCPIKTRLSYANRAIIHLKWPPSRVVPSPVLCAQHQCWNRLKDIVHLRTICWTPSWQSKIVISHV